MQNQKARELFSKYQANQCSDEERKIVETWLFFGEATHTNLTENQLENGGKEVADRLGIVLKEKNKFSYKFAAAAAVLITLGLGLFLFTSAPKNENALADNLTVTRDIEPGGSNATLKLPDGKIFNLKNAGDCMLFHDGGLSIINSKSGKLAYSVQKNLNKTLIGRNNLIHSVSTPRGGQYQVTLPDGTKVWLNSASSLKYPAQFAGNERQVQLIGEAYFEVAKNPSMPFKVSVNSITVKVLGTHFNINAYDDVPFTKTTLLEGSIQLSNGKTNELLKPNQQGIIDKTGSIKITDVNPEQAVAWKNGYFSFKRTSLPEIMQQISRWYNVDIIYKGKISADDDFVGKIKRDSDLSKTLQILELSGVHFKVKDRQIIVTPK